MNFFDQQTEVHETKHRLPHWQQLEASYFVTFRLADALPQELLSEWRDDRLAWLRLHPQPWSPEVDMEYHKRFSTTIEQWLDAEHGECVLGRPECAEIVGECLNHFDGIRCHQIAWVVMPNHVHVLFGTLAPHTVTQLLQGWKGATANRINEFLGRSGQLWQRDYFDRLIRNEQHLTRCIRYIRENPAKARLRSAEYLLYESELAKGVAQRSDAF